MPVNLSKDVRINHHNCLYSRQLVQLEETPAPLAMSPANNMHGISAHLSSAKALILQMFTHPTPLLSRAASALWKYLRVNICSIKI